MRNRKTLCLLLCVLLLAAFLLSSCRTDTPQKMYLVGTEWSFDGSAFTVTDCRFDADSPTEFGEILSPGGDFRWIVVVCDTFLPEAASLVSCTVEKSDVFSDTHSLFADPIFSEAGSSAGHKTCTLLFSVPLEESYNDLSAYTMNVRIDVNGKTYTNDFALHK